MTDAWLRYNSLLIGVVMKSQPSSPGHSNVTPGRTQAMAHAAIQPTVRVIEHGGGQHDLYGSGKGATPLEGVTSAYRGKVVIAS